MISFLFYALAACSLPVGTGAAGATGPRELTVIDTAGMRREIMEVYRREPDASFAVAFEDISTGQQLLLNPHTLFHAASTMKTPVLVEAYRQVASHRLSLNDSLSIHTDFRSIVDGSRYELDSSTDSETDLYRRAGQKMSLRDLLFQMITQSSNLSTNLVIEKVGAKNVMATMRELGAMDIRVLRGVEDEKAFEKGMNNMTTAFD
ncbi:MAG TPA: serine hydrolase, partial [Puia sp.]|nr:serine hydrolase [Puia sp.]